MKIALVLCALGPALAFAGPLEFTSAFDSYRQPTTPADVALADVDRDGRLDLLTANSTGSTSPHSVTVRRGLANGTFGTPVDYGTGLYPAAVTAGDLNGDGWPDIVSGNRGASSVSVLLNKGDGTFLPRVNYAAGSGSTSLAIGDLDGDGIPDVVVGNKYANTISVLRGLGGGVLAPKVDRTSAAGVRSVRLADWDGDGKLDVVAAAPDSNAFVVHLGNGDGTLASAISFRQSAATAVDVRDLDGDGRVDVAVAGGKLVSVRLRTADGGLGPAVDVALAATATALRLADVTNDGKPDIVVADWQTIPATDLVTVLPGLGGGTFGSPVDQTTGGQPLALAVGDIDQAAGLDVVTACAGSGTVAVHRANGFGAFGTKRPFPPHAVVGQVQAADLDGDGIPDLVAPGGQSIGWWRGHGDGTFDDPVFSPCAPVNDGQLVLADMDRDGHLDAITSTGYFHRDFVISRGTGAGTFVPDRTATMTQAYSYGFIAFDFDRDGRMDLATSAQGQGATPGNIVLLRQTETGGFVESRFLYPGGADQANTFQLASGDVTGDHWPDLVVSSSSGLLVVPSAGGGAFGPIRATSGTASLAQTRPVLADFDGDGDLDMASTDIDYGVAVLLNDGAGQFTPHPGLTAAGWNSLTLLATDLDQDGFVDLVVPGGRNAPAAPNCLSLFRGRGDGTFESRLELGVELAPALVAAADLDGDAWPELVVSTNPISILENLRAPSVAVPPPSASGPHLALAAPAPNPTRGDLRCAIDVPVAGDVEVSVVNVSGRLLRHETRTLAAGRRTLALSADRLAAGLYFLRVRQAGASATRRFVVAP